MDDIAIGTIPDSLRYRDGRYSPERLSSVPDIFALPPLRLRLGLRFIHAIHMPWFTVRLPKGCAALYTIGRKSGRPRRIYVKAARVDDKIYLISIAGSGALWVKNIRANPNVRIRLPEGTFHGTARELRNRAERQAAYNVLCETVHPFDYFENALHRTGRPTREKILELHRAWFAGGLPLVIDVERA
ncbi:nitroreductase family deazaflavin-dependent oxidoreductase [Nocardia sp. NPDC127526]|uniref:nitroreductase family deazaflavin-dependent oxidoreductase n=1 Tax=Nocardia sp. NPDC127526 TaxID=3345393 RepID=UPI00362E0D29